MGWFSTSRPWSTSWFVVCLHDGREILLPVWLRIMGSRFSRGNNHSSFWTGEKQIEEISAAYPILEASDVEVPSWWLSNRSGDLDTTPLHSYYAVRAKIIANQKF
jgi:hypothetical protein